ncbi:MAG: hypothetical protein KDC35_01595 [Acidobacteria bacterium]|nr:hypothetical protein [Acidobacteriota bacterium]
MIDIKTASQAAMRHFKEIFADDPFERIHLEEIELSEDGKLWIVLMSYDDRPSGSLGLDLLQRCHKVMKIDAETGALLAIKAYQTK